MKPRFTISETIALSVMIAALVTAAITATCSGSRTESEAVRAKADSIVTAIESAPVVTDSVVTGPAKTRMARQRKPAASATSRRHLDEPVNTSPQK